MKFKLILKDISQQLTIEECYSIRRRCLPLFWDGLQLLSFLLFNMEIPTPG